MTNEQETLFSGGVQEIIDRDAFKSILESGKKLIVKLGVDPTSVDLHLGHAVVLRKLKQFEDLGHQTVLVIGDFTAGIGDPAGVKTTRPVISPEEIAKNLTTYLDQAKLIVDLEKTQVVHNSRWLSPMTLADFIGYAAQIGVSSLLEREDFAARLKENQSISLHELLYPVVQAIDSVHLKADVELGGWDQRLNLLMGRELQKKCGQASQQVILMKPLVGLDGARKMSSSYGNYIGITESADQMMGKIMSIPDEQITAYGELAAGMNSDQLEELKSLHPREAKLRVAQAVVEMYHGQGHGEEAGQRFNQTFASKEVSPELAQPLKLSESELTAISLVAQAAQVSNSEAARLIEQGAVHLDSQPITDGNAHLEIKDGILLQIGKHRFFRLDLN